MYTLFCACLLTKDILNLFRVIPIKKKNCWPTTNVHKDSNFVYVIRMSKLFVRVVEGKEIVEPDSPTTPR